jgi:hypothetical protein
MIKLHPTATFGSILIVVGILLPPIWGIYSPIQFLVWLGLFLLINEYDKISKRDTIVRYGKYGLITYITIWAFFLIIYLFPSTDLDILPSKLFYFITHPATFIFDTIFPVTLKQLPDGDLLMDRSYFRKCISMISDVFIYVITGMIIGVIITVNKNIELTKRST